MATSDRSESLGREGVEHNDLSSQNVINNYNYFGQVNHVGRAENCNFGVNNGTLVQNKAASAMPPGLSGVPGPQSQREELPMARPLIVSGQDLFSILNPIPNASHTRDLKVALPNSQCLPGTRKSVMKDIRDWSNSNLVLGNNPHIMWIYGFAGCGKSAIAQEAAQYFDRKGRLAAAFFFFRGSGDRSKVAKFANTVAHQVATAIPATAPFIKDALAANPNLATTHTSLSVQFERLVYGPINSVKWDRLAASLRHGPFIIVLDGLDECEDHTDIATFIEKTIAFFSKKPRTPLRFLITSRVESHIHQRLYSSKQVRLLDLVDHTSDADIAAALDAAFEKEKHNRLLACAKGWPSREEKAKLVEHIGRSYIFMTTILRLLFDPNLTDGLTPMERLPLVLSQDPNFDSLYKAILSPWQHLPRFCDIVSTVALAMEPLSIVQIAELTGVEPAHTVNVLVNLHSIFHIPGDDNATVTVWHTSLRDFLCTESRAGPFYANPRHHLRLAYPDPDTHLQLGASSSRYIQSFALDHLGRFLTAAESQGLGEIERQLNRPIFKNGQTALEAASHMRKWTIVSGLANAGADLDILFKEPKIGLVCVLHVACWYRDRELVYLLLEAGANPDIVSHHTVLGEFNFGTPLVFAAYLTIANVNLVARLLACGADPNLQGGARGTALTGACFRGSLEVVELLLDHGADPNLQGKSDQWVPLHVCAAYDHEDCARALLTREADPNLRDKNGDTPLHFACSDGRVKIVKCLLEFQADSSIRNNEGETPLQVAQKKGRHYLVDTFRQHAYEILE